MEIPDKVEKLEAAPEAYRSLYLQKDNVFVFDPAGVMAANEKGLKENRDTILAEKRKLDALVTQFRELGDLEEIKEIVVKSKEKREKDIKDKGDWQAKEKSVRDEYEHPEKGKLTLAQKREQSLVKALNHALIEDQATRAIVELKGKVKVLLDHVVKNLKMVEEDGKFQVKVVDNAGEPRFVNGKDMTIKDLVAEFKKDKDFADCFIADGGSGTGSQQTHKPGAGGSEDLSKIKNPTERLKAARAQA